MSNLNAQLKRIGKIHTKVRHSIEYKIESTKVAFSEQIVERMESIGITRTELADRMGVSTPYITKLLRGTTNLTLDSMIRLADAVESEIVLEIGPGDPRNPPARATVAKPTKRPSISAKQRAPSMVHEASPTYEKKRGSPS